MLCQLVNKLYEVSVCSRTAGNLQLYVNKHEEKCTLLIVRQLLQFCSLKRYFNWKFETLFFCRGWNGC